MLQRLARRGARGAWGVCVLHACARGVHRHRGGAHAGCTRVQVCGWRAPAHACISRCAPCSCGFTRPGRARRGVRSARVPISGCRGTRTRVAQPCAGVRVLAGSSHVARMWRPGHGVFGRGEEREVGCRSISSR